MIRQLEDELLWRLNEPESAPALGPQVSRRLFMAGLAASGAAPASAHASSPRPAARWAASAVLVTFAGETWTIDRNGFGSHARLTLRQLANGFLIQLQRAVLPGTQIRADFSFSVFRRDRRWTARMSMPQFRLADECALRDWLMGRPLVSRLAPSRSNIGASELRWASGRFAVTSCDGLTLRLTSSLRVLGPVDCTATGMTLRLAQAHLSSTASWATGVSFDTPRLRPRAFACGNADTLAIARPTATRQLDGEFFDEPAGRAQALLMRGDARLDVRAPGSVIASIPFQDAVIAVAAGRIGVAGHVGNLSFPVRSRGCVASLTGDAERPFCAVFNAGHAPRFASFMRAKEMRLVVPGAHTATLSLPASNLVLAVEPNRVAADVIAGDHLVIDRDPRSAVNLDDCSLSIRCGDNLLDLNFQFRGFRCESHSAGLRLVRHRGANGKCAPAMIRVILPPQHLSETIQQIDDIACPKPGSEMEQNFTGRSRIVFKLPEEPFANARWRNRDVTLAQLLDWTGLDLEVHPRARAQLIDPALEFKDQVENTAKITRTDTLDAVIAKIAELAGPPTDEMTALELVDQLIFSPARGVQWEHESIGQSHATPLFGIRMGRLNDPHHNPHLRALSSRLLPHPLPWGAELDDIKRASTSPLTAKNHWEIIGQTSTYGLPALRRDIPADPNSTETKPNRPAFGRPRTKGTKPDPDTALAKVPRANVVRPDTDGDYQYLIDVDTILATDATGAAAKPAPRETGIALASTFQAADVTLTSLGATMRLDWHGEPPLLRPKQPVNGRQLPASFELERLAYQTWLGRDVRVVAVTKGYLIPFGLRASLMTVAERVFMPDDVSGAIAKEIIRSLIVAPRTPKRFPAVNQPDGGRDFPVSSLVLLTNRTPNLIDFKTQDGGALSIENYLDETDNPRAFWPRYHDASGKPADVMWKVMADDNSAPLVAPMIFIAAGAADDPIYLEQVIGAYNGSLRTGDPGPRTDWPPRNVALVGGARRSYAPLKEARGGGAPSVDTAFDTESWLLTARGRGGSDTGKETFIIDARMNSADQPAFYPSVARANIAIQSIDRLVGAPQGLVSTRFFGPYVAGGFGSNKASNPNNQGEIFLEVVNSSVSLNPAALGKPATGGLAQPDTKVAALSRAIGVVGGGGTISAPVIPGAAPAAGGSFDEAVKGNFDPKAFFNLKIFGIDLLRCIPEGLKLEDAPNLTELIDLGVDQKLLDNTVRPLATELFATATTLRKNIDQGIATFNGKLPSHTPPFTFASLYPDLAQTYSASMDAILAQLQTLSKATSVASIPTAAIQLSLAATPLMREIGRAVRDPIPQAISVEIDSIIQQWEVVKGLFLGLPDVLSAKLNDLVGAQLTALETLGSDELALLFGLDKGETLKALATDPALRRKASGTLLSEAVGAPLMRMLDAVSLAMADVAGAIGFARATLEAALIRAIDDQVAALAGKLVDNGTAAANVLRPADCARLAFELASALDVGLRDLTKSGDVAGAPDRLRAIRGELVDGGPAREQLTAIISASINGTADWIDTVDPSDLAGVRDAWGNGLSARIVALATASAVAMIDTVLPMVDLRASQASEAVVHLVVRAIVAPIRLASGLIDLAAVSTAARNLSAWCSGAADGALVMAQTLASGVLAPQAQLDTALNDITTALNGVTIPANVPGVFLTRFGRIKDELSASAAAAQKASTALQDARIGVARLTAAELCTDTAAAPLTFSEAIRARGELSAAMRSVAAEIAALSSLVHATADQSGLLQAAFGTCIATLTKKAADVIAGASLAGSAGQPGPWTDVIAAGKMRLEQAITQPAYLDRLTKSFDQIVTDGQTLSKALQSARPDMLPALASQAMALAALDRRFAGAIAETIALTDDARQRIEAVGLALMRGMADPLATLNDRAYQGFAPLTDLSKTYPALDYLLGGDVQEFDAAVAKIPEDAKLLHALAIAANTSEAATLFAQLSDRWTHKTMPLVSATKSLASLADKILQGQFGQLLGDSVRALFNQLESELRQVVEQFIPTKVHTSYAWKTQLNPLGDIFEVASSNKEDLTINSQISFDFLTKERKAVVEGTIRPFSIKVASLFTVYFDGATFQSVDGGEPHFRANVQDVRIGSGLSFLEVLQGLVAVQGNGIYVRPEASRITVGYAFACERTMIGSLTLSNIALDIYASLPFADTPAEFGFRFASKDRPFLISNPPYGGGGWVAIRCTAGGTPAIDLSFMFGAVTDIAFGPLKGRGRICAGIEFQSDSQKLTAFVEAVGEGNIACFSISIYIGIFLTHYGSGDFIGEARYEFKFKVGFVTLSYGVTARYTIAKGSDNTSPPPSNASQKVVDSRGLVQRLLDEVVPPAFAAPTSSALPTHVQRVDVPLKTRAWDRYRQLISMELLDA